MRQPAVDLLRVAAAATLLTLIIAAPVVRAPSERIFGADSAGWHHDPITVMQQFTRPIRLGVYSQLVTDLTGAAIARVTGAIAAYNWLVLLSFPLSAAAAYLLARHLLLPPAAATLAALLFAFSPFHLAHAAYHPHIAQTQWLPLHLLALWRCMDEGDAAAVAFLIAATIAVVLSNFYGGLIAAVIAPIAVTAYWYWRARFAPHALRRLGITAGTLGGLALAGTAFAWWIAPGVVTNPSAFAFERSELFRYSAKWWSYAVPPVAHPLLGGLARRIWTAARVDEGLLEQQVSLGWGVIALGAIGAHGWLTPRAPDDRAAPGRAAQASVPILVALALVALVCSLSPERTILGLTIARPSAALYRLVPMFRSYARFGVIVQLMAALLAGVGASRLLAYRTAAARVTCAVLVALAVAEYAVWPPAFSRDVLPTAADRWVMREPHVSRVLDCAPVTAASATLAWLTDGRVAPLDDTFTDCAEPQLSAKLLAGGFSHILVGDSWERRWIADHEQAADFVEQARGAGAVLVAVSPRPSLVATQLITGFWPREHKGRSTWRWMGADASWTILASAPQPGVVLELEMSAFHTTRPLTIRLDGRQEHTLQIATGLRTYRAGPFDLTAGSHLLTFHSRMPATTADEVIANGDRRALSFAVSGWKWSR